MHCGLPDLRAGRRANVFHRYRLRCYGLGLRRCTWCSACSASERRLIRRYRFTCQVATLAFAAVAFTVCGSNVGWIEQSATTSDRHDMVTAQTEPGAATDTGVDEFIAEMTRPSPGRCVVLVPLAYRDPARIVQPPRVRHDIPSLPTGFNMCNRVCSALASTDANASLDAKTPAIANVLGVSDMTVVRDREDEPSTGQDLPLDAKPPNHLLSQMRH